MANENAFLKLKNRLDELNADLAAAREEYDRCDANDVVGQLIAVQEINSIQSQINALEKFKEMMGW